MNIIKKITIHRFRSISDVSIDTSEITIFSGLNNSGKSNVLRALNLFFTGKSSFGQEYDFEKDYNKAFTGQAGGKRAIKIELLFYGQGTAALKSCFSISRTFQMGQLDPETEYSSEEKNVQDSIDKKDGNITRQFTRFLNKIEYFYIPAVRDKRFVRDLFLHFEKLIEHDSGNDFKDKMGDLSQVLQKNSQDISNDFQSFIGLPTQAVLSSKITDILGTVEVNVQTGMKVLRRKKGNKEEENVYVNLFSSGDGILMSYLAYFLAHVCKKISNKMFIWGFEEPENSLEYSKIQKIAEAFFSEFRKNAQIFITTHSPAFIELKKNKEVGFFRVYIDSEDKKQASIIKPLDEIKTKQQSLFDEGNTCSSEYKMLTRELYFVEFANEIEDAVKKVTEEANRLSDERTKYIKLHRKLLNSKPSKIFICEDSDSIKLWDKWLTMFKIKNVKVMTSNGSTQNLVENGVRYQQTLISDYKPKVFRQIDRDGLTDQQIKIIEDKIFKKEKGFPYKYSYLPLYEIENIAVVSDTSSFTDDLWTQYRDNIEEHFERTATEKLKIFDKTFNYQEKDFRGENANYTSVMQKMRSSARANWRKYFPGKELCKIVKNYNFIAYLSSLKESQLPQEFIDYMATVKEFFIDDAQE